MSGTNPMESGFSRKCSFCGISWVNREEFLADPDIDFIGYQATFQKLKPGLFLFNHSHCHSTMAVGAEAFSDLYDGPVFSERRTGKESCLGMCEHKDELGLYPEQCECAYVSAVCNTLRTWPKFSAV